MEFLVNDLSMEGQFHDLRAFEEAVGRIMTLREQLRRDGYSLHCNRGLASARVTPQHLMQQAVHRLPQAARRAWMQWLTQFGPHWEDDRLHDGDDWLEVDGEIVTDSAVGEAAACAARGLERDLVSFQPSSWLTTPIDVRWVRDDGMADDISVPNHWDVDSIARSLRGRPRPVTSWAELAVRSVARCSRLTFSDDAFVPLQGQPFSPGAAERIRVLLNTLDRMKGCFHEDGTRTCEGHRLYQDHFTGDKAWFSDSSDTEKRQFRNALTFACPGRPAESLFCTWHGKVKTPQYRIHFSWPICADGPLYVVYVGPKITRR